MGTGPKLPSHSSSCLRLGLSRDRKVGQFGICHGYFQHPHLYYTALHTAKWVESEPSCRMRATPATSGAQSPHAGWGQAQETVQGTGQVFSCLDRVGQEASCVCLLLRARAEQLSPVDTIPLAP